MTIDPGRAVRSLLARHLAGFAFNFAGSLYLARVLGPAAWGTYSIAYVLQIIVQGLLERGTAGYLIQRREAPGRAELGATLVIQGAAGLGTALVLALAAAPLARFFESPELAPLLLAVGLSAMAYALRAIPIGLLERGLSYRRVAAVEVTDLAAFNLVTVAAVAAGAGFGGLVLGTLVRAIASLALAWSLAPMRAAPVLTRAAMRELAAFAVPYTTANALSWANVAAAPVLVGRLVGTRELGVLQLAYTLVLYPQLLTTIVGRVAFPLYARMKDDTAAIQGSVDRATAMALRYVGALMIAVASTSPIWVPFLYGSEWLGMIPIMLVIAPALGFSMSLTFVIAALNAAGRVRPVLLAGSVFTLLYWALAWLLVPAGGALGLATAQVLATISFVGYIVLYRNSLGPLRIRRPLVEYLVLCLTSLVVASATALV